MPLKNKENKKIFFQHGIKFGTRLSEMVSGPHKHETTSPGGLAFMGAECGVPFMTQIC